MVVEKIKFLLVPLSLNQIYNLYMLINHHFKLFIKICNKLEMTKKKVNKQMP